MSDYRIVVVRWHDAVGYRNTNLEKIDDIKGLERVTIGILRRDAKDYVLIQTDINPRDMQDLNYAIKIPKDLITSLTKISCLSINEIIGED